MLVGEHPIAGTQGASKWANHPSHQRRLILVSAERVRILEWRNSSELSGPDGMDPGLQGRAEIETANVFFSSRGHTSSFRALLPKLPPARPQLFAFGLPTPPLSITPADLNTLLATVTKLRISEPFTGTYRTQLISVDHDGWVCSIDMDGTEIVPKAFPDPVSAARYDETFADMSDKPWARCVGCGKMSSQSSATD